MRVVYRSGGKKPSPSKRCRPLVITDTVCVLSSGSDPDVLQRGRFCLWKFCSCRFFFFFMFFAYSKTGFKHQCQQLDYMFIRLPVSEDNTTAQWHYNIRHKNPPFCLAIWELWTHTSPAAWTDYFVWNVKYIVLQDRRSTVLYSCMVLFRTQSQEAVMY